MHDWLINVGFIYLFMLLKKDDVLRIFFLMEFHLLVFILPIF